MRNLKAIGLLALAVITGLAAAIYAAGWVAQRGTLAATKVVTAAVDIELGSKITPQMLTVAEWPSDSVPTGAFKDPKEVQDRVVKTSLTRGEAVLDRKLASAGTQGGLSAVIAEGKRAMTVRVNDVVGVAGFALPGNYVDVMVNAQRDNGTGQQATPISMTVLEHVLVLAIAQEAGRDDTKPKVVNAVTLELSLQDAERLDLARSVGTLSLVLRNQLDKTTVATAGISKGQLFGLQPAVEVKPQPVIKARVAAPVRTSTKVMGMAPAPVAPARACVDVIWQGTKTVDCF